jgi:hypothetical protein
MYPWPQSDKIHPVPNSPRWRKELDHGRQTALCGFAAAHLWNHTGLSAPLSLDGLTVPAFDLEAEHDLYTAAAAEKRAEQGIDPDSLELASTYRCVLLARPEVEECYILSLDAGSFSEDDLLEFAGSFRY